MIEIKLKEKDQYLDSAGYSREDQVELYAAQLEDVLQNTRWYLDNLHWLPTYKVYWFRYTRKKGAPELKKESFINKSAPINKLE